MDYTEDMQGGITSHPNQTNHLIYSYNPSTSSRNLTPYSWTVGHGTTGFFYALGTAAENERILAANPWGEPEIIWQAAGSGIGGWDGGWETTPTTIDPTQTYRFVIWVNEFIDGNGGFRFGLYALDNLDNNIGVYYRHDNRDSFGVQSYSRVPYFSRTELPTNITEWTLYVGHVLPIGSGIGDKHPDSGVYNITGKIGDTDMDFVWRENTTQASHRAFLLSGTDTIARLLLARPRLDCCDGTELTITQLLQGVEEVPTGCLVVGPTMDIDGTYNIHTTAAVRTNGQSNVVLRSKILRYNSLELGTRLSCTYELE